MMCGNSTLIIRGLQILTVIGLAGCANQPVTQDSSVNQQSTLDPNGGGSTRITTDPGNGGSTSGEVTGGTTGGSSTGGSSSGGAGCGLESQHGVGNPEFCGHNQQKVVVCHIPPGNPSNAHSICISTHAVQTHIDHHGDRLGRCDDENECDFDGNACGGSECDDD